MPLEPKAFARAKAETEIAREKYERMKVAIDLAEVAALWSEFLTCHQRAFTRLRKAAEKGPSKGWFDQVLHERDSDDMLKYIHQARNADEHGIEDITKRTDSSVKIHSADPKSQYLYIKHLEMSKKGIYIDPETAKQVKIIIDPGTIELLPVRNRGIVYALPTSHLGNPLTNTKMMNIAELSIAYIERLMRHAEKNFA